MKIKKYMAIFISVIPFNILRIFFYRIFLRYEISYNSHIGPMSILICKKCKIDGAQIGFLNRIEVTEFSMQKGSTIGKFNKFLFLNKVNIGKNCIFVSRNLIAGTRPGISPFKDNEVFFLGNGSAVLQQNIIDISETVTIGKNVVIGGFGTQIWTHGFSHDRVKIQAAIVIADNVFIGSRSIILPSVSICSNVVIGSGSVISKSIKEEGFYVSSAQVKKSENISIIDDDIVKLNGAKFYRKDINV